MSGGHKYFDGVNYHSDDSRLTNVPPKPKERLAEVQIGILAKRTGELTDEVAKLGQRIERLEWIISQQNMSFQRLNQFLALVEQILRAKEQ